MSPRLRVVWLGALVVGAWLGLGAVAPAAHADPAEVRARAAKVLADPDFQRELPGPAKPPPGASSAPEHRPGEHPPGERRRVDEPDAEPGGGSAAASAVMWLVFGIGALLLVALAVREWRGFEPPVVATGGGDATLPIDDAATAAVVARPLGDAEALAQAGRFGDAIHVLLLRTLEELMRRSGRPLPRSRTSREILAEARLPDEARGALGHLVSAVEVSFFGGSEPGAGDYQLCVERFRRFAEAYARGVRA